MTSYVQPGRCPTVAGGGRLAADRGRTRRGHRRRTRAVPDLVTDVLGGVLDVLGLGA